MSDRVSGYVGEVLALLEWGKTPGVALAAIAREYGLDQEEQSKLYDLVYQHFPEVIGGCARYGEEGSPPS